MCPGLAESNSPLACISADQCLNWKLVNKYSGSKFWLFIIRWTQSFVQTNGWVINKAGVKRELLDTVKARKLAYYGHTMRKQGSCLEKEIIQGTMPGACRRGRLRTAWMDNIKTWTGLPVEESVRMTEDRDKWRKYVHGMANPRIEDG